MEGEKSLMGSPMEWEEAAALLLREVRSPAAERVKLAQALGRILAEDVAARLPVPPFDKSPFDGYACRASDVPGRLRVIGVAAAGCRALPEIRAGEALRIFTGAPIPPGADAVVKQEDVEADGAALAVTQGVLPGTNIVRRGEELPDSACLLRRGTRLSPGDLGLLASQGIAELRVYQKPTAVLIPTGDELTEPGEPRSPYGIYNSSSFALTAYLEKMGFAVKRRPIVPDEAEATCCAVHSALEGPADLVFTTGGASVGDYDFAARTVKTLGAEALINKVNMKPGGALRVSRRKGKLLVNLSGNPAAALMSLLTVLRPALCAMTGESAEIETLMLPVWEDMPKESTAVRMLRGSLLLREDGAWFREHQGRGNGNIASFAGCELIGIVPGGSAPLKKGDRIRVLRLPHALL